MTQCCPHLKTAPELGRRPFFFPGCKPAICTEEMNSQDYKVRKETPCVCLLHKARTAPPLLCIHPSPFTQSFWVRLEHNHLIAKSMQLSSPIPLSLNKSLATTRYVDGYQKGEKTKNPTQERTNRVQTVPRRGPVEQKRGDAAKAWTRETTKSPC